MHSAHACPNTVPLSRLSRGVFEEVQVLVYMSEISTASPCISGIRLSGSSQYRDFFNGHYKVKVSLITGKNSITVVFPGHPYPDIQGLAVFFHSDDLSKAAAHLGPSPC